MDPAVLSAIVISIGSMVVAVITVRQNRQGAKATNALTERVVNREDFDLVMGRMKEDLDRSDRRIGDLEKRLEEEVEARQEADSRASEADRRAAEAERRAQIAEERALRLEARVTQLEETLREHNIEVPTPVDLDKKT